MFESDLLSQVPEHAKAGLAKMNANARFASRPAEERYAIIQDTLERALADERIEDIAKSYGLPETTLNYNLLAHANEEWRHTQIARAQTRAQQAENEFDSIKKKIKEEGNTEPNGLRLAYARESLKHAQWTLEKLYRRLYGDDKTAINVNTAGAVSIQVVSFAEQNPAIDAAQQVQRSMDSQVIEGEKG